MAKLTILAALLVALLAFAEASTFRTTVTIEEENPRGSQSQRCREQMQRQQMQHCEMYLSQGRQYQMGLRMITNQQQQHLQQCCQQLENMDEECRCQAIREMIRQRQQMEEIRGEEMQEMVQRAQNLPRRCNLEPRRCQIQAIGF